MNAPRFLTSLSVAAALGFSLSTPAQAQKKGVGSQVSMKPSVIGGAPIQVAVYNFTNLTATGYWVTPAGVLQPLPGAPTVPPTGNNPITINSFRQATIFLQRPKGGGVWKHFGGGSPKPFISLGNPPPGWVPPGKTGGKSVPDAGGEVPDGAKVVVNVPGGGKGKRKTVEVTNNTTTITPPAPALAPAPAPAPAAAAEPEKEKGKRKPRNAKDPQVIEFLAIHNAARKDVGLAPLEWSRDLAATAQEWADELAKTGKLTPRPESKYGENLGMGPGDYSPATAANAWLAEKADYSPDTGKKGKRTAAKKAVRYTQMVWGKSTMVGYGIATTKDGKVVVVANYNPRGNIEGEKPY